MALSDVIHKNVDPVVLDILRYCDRQHYKSPIDYGDDGNSVVSAVAQLIRIRLWLDTSLDDRNSVKLPSSSILVSAVDDLTLLRHMATYRSFRESRKAISDFVCRASRQCHLILEEQLCAIRGLLSFMDAVEAASNIVPHEDDAPICRLQMAFDDLADANLPITKWSAAWATAEKVNWHGESPELVPVPIPDELESWCDTLNTAAQPLQDVAA